MTRQEKLRLIVQLSIPGILAQISFTVMFFIDQSMVGHLGNEALASIGLIETTTWLMGSLANAANLGFSVQVAHYVGANDFEGARRVLRQALSCCFIFSLALALTGIIIHPFLPYWLGGGTDIAHNASLYFLIVCIGGIFFQMEGLAGSMLKCAGNMKVPSMLSIMMCVLDVVFNYLFIYILGYGVPGAAMGTVCAEVITAFCMMWFLIYRSKELSLAGHPGSFRPKADTVKTAFKIGVPMGIQYALMNGAQIISTTIVAPLGNVAIAANSAAITVESLCYMPGYGIAEAATTLVGQGIGAGQRVLTQSIARMSVGVGMLIMTFMGALMFIFAPELMALITDQLDTIAEGAAVLRIKAFAEPFFAAAIVCNGVFVGAADTLKPAIMNLTSMWGVRLTLAWWLSQSHGLRGVWTAMAIELTFRGIIFLTRLFHGGWNKQLKLKHTTAK